MTRLWTSPLLFLLVSCACALAASSAQGRETKLHGEAHAAENINPSRRGTPQPVKLHVFYLAEDDSFLAASFGGLVGSAEAELGKDLVKHTELLIAPGETATLDETFDEAAKFIGVVAAFTNIDRADWRAVVELPEKKWTDVVRLLSRNKLEIRIDDISISCEIVRD